MLDSWEYVSHQPGHFKQCLTMCLTALKNSLVLGNCQPIISTPSSGLSLALHLPLSLSLFHSICVLISRHLSLYISFSLLTLPSKFLFSVTFSKFFPFSVFFFSILGHQMTKCSTPPCRKALLIEQRPFFHSFLSPFLSSSAAPSCKTAPDASY